MLCYLNQSGGTATNRSLTPFLPPSHRSWGINRLGTGKFYMNENRYPGRYCPLTIKSARSLIVDLYAGHPEAPDKNQIIDTVEQRHLALEGRSEGINVTRYVSAALRQLPNAQHGGVSNRRSFWRIERQELGTGGGWVYLFYDLENQQDAINRRRWIWKCNIGQTRQRDPIDRIRQQTGTNSIVPLLIRTDDPLTLEGQIHSRLREFGRQLDNTGTNEDFLTCPSEVAEIYGSITRSSTSR